MFILVAQRWLMVVTKYRRYEVLGKTLLKQEGKGLTHHSEHGGGDEVLLDEVAEKEREDRGHHHEEVEQVPRVLRADV